MRLRAFFASCSIVSVCDCPSRMNGSWVASLLLSMTVDMDRHDEGLLKGFPGNETEMSGAVG